MSTPRGIIKKERERSALPGVNPVGRWVVGYSHPSRCQYAGACASLLIGGCFPAVALPLVARTGAPSCLVVIAPPCADAGRCVALQRGTSADAMPVVLREGARAHVQQTDISQSASTVTQARVAESSSTKEACRQ